jgi:hypothetical protein
VRKPSGRITRAPTRTHDIRSKVLGSACRTSLEKWKMKKSGRNNSEDAATAIRALRCGREAVATRLQYTPRTAMTSASIA